MESARERWAALVNDTLKGAGRDERVDHRSYGRQGIDREPGRHFGPGAATMLERSGSHDRLERAADQSDAERTLSIIDAEISQLESTRAGLLREMQEDEDRSHGSSGGAPNRDDEFSWGR